MVDTVIATTWNHIIVPPRKLEKNPGGLRWFTIPGYDSQSPEIVLSTFNPYWVVSRQRLHLWYAEDFINKSEVDNGGKVCCEVYTLFV